jgi:threonine/homoserine efflux transporter RhtA
MHSDMFVAWFLGNFIFYFCENLPILSSTVAAPFGIYQQRSQFLASPHLLTLALTLNSFNSSHPNGYDGVAAEIRDLCSSKFSICMVSHP